MNTLNGKPLSCIFRNLSRRRAGHTLVELMMVAAVLPILFFGVASVVTMASVVINSTGAAAQLNLSAAQALRYINREIGQSSPSTSSAHLNLSTDASNNTVVRFQIPVDWDNDGDVVTAGMNPSVEWGAYDEANQKQDGRLNAWVRYSVVNQQLIREVLDSALNPIDGLSRVVANHVQLFTVSKSSSILSVNLTFQNADTVGQAGAQRIFQSSLNSSTVLRNAVT